MILTCNLNRDFKRDSENPTLGVTSIIDDILELFLFFSNFLGRVEKYILQSLLDFTRTSSSMDTGDELVKSTLSLVRPLDFLFKLI